jgi:hypothetical protein
LGSAITQRCPSGVEVINGMGDGLDLGSGEIDALGSSEQ